MKEKSLPGPVIITFGRLDARALGGAVAVVFGLFLFLTTIILVFKGGPVVGPTLSLLSQYFPGYEVTAPGAVLGFLYGAVCGFVIGYSFAHLRNGIAHLFLLSVKRRSEQATISDLL